MTRRGVHVTSAIAILVIAFFYQVTRPAFLNDHFDHLSKARQMLHGEYPVRDFFDPGRPLTVGLSAAVLALSHDTLLGEAMLTMGAIAVGVMLVYWLAQRYTGSILWGYWAAACMLAIDLRLYNYPKILAPMVAVWLIARYLDAPSAARAACLGAWGGLGFLFRHDLGVYLAVATLAALLLRRSRDTARNVAIVGTVAGLVAAPYLIYLQQINALGSVAAEGGEGFLSAVRVSWIPFVSPFEYPGWRRINAEIWVYYLFLFTPLVAFGAWLTRRITRPLSDHVVTLAVLCAALTLFLIRGNIDSRLPDVAAPSFGPGGLDAGSPIRRRPHAQSALAMDPGSGGGGGCHTDRSQRARARRMAVCAQDDSRHRQAAHVDLGADRVPGFGAARGLGE